MTPPYPLTFEPILKEKVWGGRRLEQLGKELPANIRIGESWELADLGSTSASGGGGSAARSVVSNGPLKGTTLQSVVTLWGTDLMGGTAEPAGDFPLLLKFLDANKNLSVQVHPSPAYAGRHPEAHLKTESWFVVDAEPGAVIYKGLSPGVTRDSLRTHIETGAVADDLVAIPVRAGDCFNLPSGTIHGLGRGILVAEVQTPSDTTFRVYDWGRTDRELHIEAALECIDFDPAPPAEAARHDTAGARSLVRTGFFEILQHNAGPGDPVDIAPAGMPLAIMVISGSICIHSRSDVPELAVEAGGVALLPAQLQYEGCAAGGEGAQLLEIRLPVN